MLIVKVSTLLLQETTTYGMKDSYSFSGGAASNPFNCSKDFAPKINAAIPEEKFKSVGLN